MLDKYHILDTIVKFKAYYSIITLDKDLTYYKSGDVLSSEAIFNFNMYLELYIWLLEYSLTWFDDADVFREDDSPITISEINLVIDRGDELIKSMIQLPINY